MSVSREGARCRRAAMLEKNRGSIADSPEVFDCDDHAAAFVDAQEEKGPKFTKILECPSILRKKYRS